MNKKSPGKPSNGSYLKYGRFDADTREFVIRDPRTPAPWINYLMGRDLQAFISQGAGGTAWFREPVHGRLTRYRFNGLPADAPGFHLYIRDGKSLWNPSYFPVMTELDRYECRHAPGTTRFLSAKDGLSAEVRYFIPTDDNVMIWDAILTNTTRAAKRISLYTYIEFSLHGFSKDTDAFLVCGNQYRAFFDRAANGVVVDYFAWESPFFGKSIFASTQPVKRYDVDRDVFIGKGRTEANPIGLEKGLSGSELRDGGRYSCGVLENELVIPPGATRRIAYLHAVSSQLAASRRLVRKYSAPGAVDRAYVRLRRHWETTLSVSKVETPDAELDAMLNTWFPCNTRVTFNIGRSISARHTGSGDAWRFRDSMQDTMPAVTYFPREARAKILKLYRTMMASGKTVTGVNPQTLLTTNAEWTRIDGALWGVFTVYRYLAETGDTAILDEVVPYYDAGEGTVLDHLLRGMKFIGGHDGPDGLPLIFNVDWNDMLTLFSSAYRDVQSVMVAEQFIYAARLLDEILESAGSPDLRPWLKKKTAHYTAVLNSDACWDGAWFKRLLMKGMVMGSRRNREAKIFLNAQSWAVIAGTLEPEKTRRAMESVRTRLATANGIRLFEPPFTKMLDNRTPFHCNTPGAGENGGIFLHANTWAVMAESLLGNAEQAWTYYRSILPCALAGRDADRYANEPYVFSSWVYGPDHERFGNGQLSWLTGGASWMHTIGLEYILGVRPTLKGIVFRPCVPGNWKTYSLHRRLRGCRYDVTVVNPHGLTSGAVSITADGKPVPGDTLPYATGKVCRVTVSLVP